MSWRRTTGLLLICAGLAVLTLKFSRVWDPAPAVERAADKAGPKVASFVKRVQPERVAYVGLIGLPVCVGIILMLLSAKGKAAAPAKTERPEHAAVAPAWKAARGKVRLGDMAPAF